MSVAQAIKNRAIQPWDLGTMCTHGCMPAVAVAIRKRQRGLFYRLALDKICCLSGGKAKSSPFVNRQGHALLFRPEAQPNLARQGHGQALFHRLVARPSFAPSSSARPVVLTTKRQGQVLLHRQAARPSLVLSSRGIAKSCSSKKKTFRGFPVIMKRDLGHWFCPWWLC